MVKILHQMTKVAASDPKDLDEKLQRVNSAVKMCHYPDWVSKKVSDSLGTTDKDSKRRKTSGTCIKPSQKTTMTTKKCVVKFM